MPITSFTSKAVPYVQGTNLHAFFTSVMEAKDTTQSKKLEATVPKVTHLSEHRIRTDC